MSKDLETISVLDNYLVVDTTNRRVCEMSNPTYDRMFRGSRFANEMATLLVEYRNRIAELEEQLKNARVKYFIGFDSNFNEAVKELDLNIVLPNWMHDKEFKFYDTKEEAQAKLQELKGEKK